eukprot:804500-Rhodomonas_salina.1
MTSSFSTLLRTLSRILIRIRTLVPRHTALGAVADQHLRCGRFSSPRHKTWSWARCLRLFF